MLPLYASTLGFTHGVKGVRNMPGTHKAPFIKIALLVVSALSLAVFPKSAWSQNCEAQRRLSELRLYFGPIDCMIGPQSRSAIMVFQGERGLPRTGNLDSDTLRELFEAQIQCSGQIVLAGGGRCTIPGQITVPIGHCHFRRPPRIITHPYASGEDRVIIDQEHDIINIQPGEFTVRYGVSGRGGRPHVCGEDGFRWTAQGQ